MDKIQSGYIDNTYHNKIHAFDVTITVNFFLSTCDFINVGKLTPLELSYAYIGIINNSIRNQFYFIYLFIKFFFFFF